jgi:hypothetical protein
VKPVGPLGDHASAFGGELTEVGGEDGGRDDAEGRGVECAVRKKGASGDEVAR